jgi:broad specificity phosphatase PhoE
MFNPGDLPVLFLARHGDTAWTDSGQYTGRTDLPLNARGEKRARQIGEELARFTFAHVFTSPLQRATQTCTLAGFGESGAVDVNLVEWDYGNFEGKLTPDIQRERPGWRLFRDGCPNGETPQTVAERANRFIERARGLKGNVLAFSSGHIIRMIAARWLGLPPDAGGLFHCRPASVGVLGFAHGSWEEPVLIVWNHIAQETALKEKIEKDKESG